MSEAEFEAWKVYASVEPIGALRSDIQTAMIVTTLMNVHRSRKKRPQPFELRDVLPDWWREQSNPATLKRKLKAAFAALKGDKVPAKPADGPQTAHTEHRG